jgi:hypothetical protein
VLEKPEEVTMRVSYRQLVLSLLAAIMLMTAAASSVEAANPKGALAVPIVGTPVAPNTNTVFNGVLTITGFGQQNGNLVAFGTLVGTLTNTTTNTIVGTIVQTIVLPILNPPVGTCDILDLVLGPLDLDLLGLRVHLNQVVLHIDAQAGPGNLLGNLLCSVAHLLDGGNLNALVNTLNQLLGALLGL